MWLCLTSLLFSQADGQAATVGRVRMVWMALLMVLSLGTVAWGESPQLGCLGSPSNCADPVYDHVIMYDNVQ